MLDKIEALSMQSRAYQRLKAALIAGFFEPGQVLVIRELAEQLGTSAMPIRQAVSRLISEHALQEDDKPRSSVSVPPLSLDMFEDLRQTRVLVESQAAALAAGRVDQADLEQLRQLNSAIETAVDDADINATITANCEFHFALYRMAGSTTLLRIIESLWLQSGPYFRVLVQRYFDDRYNAQRGPNAHPQLLDAIARRDPEAAREAMCEDINGAAEYFLTLPNSTVPPHAGSKSQESSLMLRNFTNVTSS